jgi:hypothetical protein
MIERMQVAERRHRRAVVPLHMNAPRKGVGHHPFFIEFVKQGPLFDTELRIARCITGVRTRRTNGTLSARCCFRCWLDIGVTRT